MTDLTKRDPIDPEIFYPTFNRVLIRPVFDEDEVADFDETGGIGKLRSSGLFIPASVVEAKQDELAMKKAYHVRGLLARSGPFAYQGLGYPEELVPQEGDEVFINNNPGMELEDTEGNPYRICNEKDVISAIKPNLRKPLPQSILDLNEKIRIRKAEKANKDNTDGRNSTDTADNAGAADGSNAGGRID